LQPPTALYGLQVSATLVLFHPDYTVGPGITPDLLTPPRWALAG
jgi:hypothetical protein